MSNTICESVIIKENTAKDIEISDNTKTASEFSEAVFDCISNFDLSNCLIEINGYKLSSRNALRP